MHDCTLKEDYESLAEAFHGILGRLLMVEARLDCLEKLLREKEHGVRQEESVSSVRCEEGRRL
jgi:hypothetical protein